MYNESYYADLCPTRKKVRWYNYNVLSVVNTCIVSPTLVEM